MDLERRSSDPIDCIVAVIRAPSAGEARAIAIGLYQAGVRNLELTLTVPGALGLVAELVDHLPEATIGVGTIRTTTDLREAAAAGARFCVSPIAHAQTVSLAHELDMPFIAGALTPSEIAAAAAAGAAAVKVFPVGAVGGSRYLAAVHEVFPDISYWVSGSIALSEIDSYSAAGASLICIGSALVDRAAANALDIDGVAAHAHMAIRGLRSKDAFGGPGEIG
jgi:2-dehydro-3-deoxyphosphogluconate aldolase/(4S)-4-hydroxy-2-oxoglutarate aldolase